MDPPTAYGPGDAASGRIGGLSAVTLGVAYIVITALYVVTGALPDDAAEQLRHLADHTTTWWAILFLSVATDILFVPVMWSLYRSLKGVNREAMLAGTGLVGLFVILDLAVTWPNYAALISLGDRFAATNDDAQRSVLLGAASYAVSVLSSGLFGVYALLLPGLGILLIGLVMLRGGFGRVAAYLGVATGVLGIVAVVGPLVAGVANLAAVLTAILTTVWVLLVGYKLLTPANRPAATYERPGA